MTSSITSSYNVLTTVICQPRYKGSCYRGEQFWSQAKIKISLTIDCVRRLSDYKLFGSLLLVYFDTFGDQTFNAVSRKRRQIGKVIANFIGLRVRNF